MTGGHAIATPTVDLRILAGGGMAGVWADLKPRFEEAAGHRLDLFFGTTPNLIREATSGRPFDAGIVPADVLQDPASRARFAPAATIEIARAGLGVAVRSGAPRQTSERPIRSGEPCSTPPPLPRSPKAPPAMQSPAPSNGSASPGR